MESNTSNAGEKAGERYVDAEGFVRKERNNMGVSYYDVLESFIRANIFRDRKKTKAQVYPDNLFLTCWDTGFDLGRKDEIAQISSNRVCNY